jgi:hypothetical protein
VRAVGAERTVGARAIGARVVRRILVVGGWGWIEG